MAKIPPQTGVTCRAACPACGKKYRWRGKPQGRKCKCGTRFGRVTVTGRP